MKVKTSELQGTALNLMVAKCKGLNAIVTSSHRVQVKIAPNKYKIFDPITDWSQGGKIMDAHQILVFDWDNNTGLYTAKVFEPYADVVFGQGETQLIAAMRCYVAWKLGEEVEIPNSLIIA